MTALLFVLDGQVRSGLVGNDAGVAGCGVGGDPPSTLGTAELAAAVAEFAVSCPPPQRPVDIPIGHVFGFGVFGWDVSVFGHPRWQQGSRGVEESLAVRSDLDEVGVVDLRAGVVHGHIDAHLVEWPDERLSFVGVGTIGDNVAEAWRDLVRLQDELQSDGSGVGCSRSDVDSEDVSRWGWFDSDLVWVA